jgi:hypothetical protein
LNLIFNLFFKGKVLVTTGNPFSPSNKSEVIDLEDASNICQELDDYPIKAEGAVGGLFNEVDPVVCGSTHVNICYMVNQPDQSLEMLEIRGFAASLTLNRTHIWITGGIRSVDWTRTKTSEFVSIGQPAVKGPDLPYSVHSHCLVRINSSTVLLCGGFNVHFVTKECYYMDLEDQSWSKGPSLITERRSHTCGMFKSAAHLGRNVVIAVGGKSNGGTLNSVEILDPTTNGWIEGMYDTQ